MAPDPAQRKIRFLELDAHSSVHACVFGKMSWRLIEREKKTRAVRAAFRSVNVPSYFTMNSGGLKFVFNL